MGWLTGKKTYTAAIGAILLIVGEWLKLGDFSIGNIINLVQQSLPYLVAIFLRQGVSKVTKNG